MAVTVISTNTNGQFAFSGTGQALEVIAGVTYYDGGSFVAYSAFGRDAIDAEGAISGTTGIFDFSSEGEDTFEIGAEGSIIGVTADAIEVNGGNNSVINLGVVDGGGGISFGSTNLINNQGQIVGAFHGIRDFGYDRIDNAAVTIGSLSTAAFDANLASDLGPTKRPGRCGAVHGLRRRIERRYVPCRRYHRHGRLSGGTGPGCEIGRSDGDADGRQFHLRKVSANHNIR